MTNIRSPIVSVLGHVDHGKSSILDSIRGSNILATEAGAITQAIGASIIPLEVVEKKCGDLLTQLNMKLTIPGLLFIDTPGHAAFTGLRKRGGSLADIAVVVIDINEGFKPQTIEAIEILRASKTPFIIAANKIDLLPGYRKKNEYFCRDILMQDQRVQDLLDTRIYEILGVLHDKFKLECERFDRADFTRQVAVVPVSAKQNIGIPEMLMVLTGLAQRFLEQSLKIEVKGPAKGTILEVKEVKGLGLTLDVIIYDGTIKVNDIIVIGGIDEPHVSKVRALLLPAPLSELRDKKAKYTSVKEVSAACGIKVSAPDLKDAIAGMPLRSATLDNIEEIKEQVKKEVQSVLFETNRDGIILKADSLGSLEAMIKLLQEKGIHVRKASVGEVTKKDISDAESAYEKDILQSAILGFNIPDAKSTERCKIIVRDVIYKLLDDYLQWQEEAKKEVESRKLNLLVRPCKIEVLKNCIFRQTNPCIVGIEVLGGVLKPNTPLMKEGIFVGNVKSMQCENLSIGSGDKGRQCAVSIPGACGGRSIEEQDILYSDIPEDDFRQIKKLVHYLKGEEKTILKEIVEIKRRDNPVWGI